MIFLSDLCALCGKSKFWEVATRFLHILTVFITDALDQFVFFNGRSHQQDGNCEQDQQKNKPFGTQQTQSNKIDETRGIERMPHPAIGAINYQAVFFSDGYCFGDVFAQAAENPIKQGHTKDHKSNTKPTNPERQCQL